MSHPTLETLIKTHANLKDEIIETPTLEFQKNIFLKLELKQKTGSFKIRGALNFIRSLSKDQLSRGLTAFSGGNHAIAVAYAAKSLGVSAKVVMPVWAPADRIEKCKKLGAEVFIGNTRPELPQIANRFVTEEGRTLVHPFDHPRTIEGAAGAAIEFMEQVSGLEVVFAPIGGGGLAAGTSCAIKQMNPDCKVIGVQAVSADAMYRSFKSGKPESNITADTVADSLTPPKIGDHTFAVCRKFLDDVLLVEEKDIKSAMRLLKESQNLMVEGAGAISLAAALKATQFQSKKIGVIVSGSNIDEATFLKNSLG